MIRSIKIMAKDRVHRIFNLQKTKRETGVFICKGPFTQAIFVAATQCNFVAPKLQFQNRTCKPLCDFGGILAIYRRVMRYN